MNENNTNKEFLYGNTTMFHCQITEMDGVSHEFSLSTKISMTAKQKHNLISCNALRKRNVKLHWQTLVSCFKN